MSTLPPPSPAAGRGRVRLGDALVAQGAITGEQLTEALAVQRNAKGTRLGHLLVDLGFVSEVQICEAVSHQLQIPAADLVAVDVEPSVLALVPRELALKYACLPWMVQNRDLYLIMADPTDLVAADDIGFRTGLRVRPVVAPESELLLALERFYEDEDASLARFESLDLAAQVSVVAETPEADGLLDAVPADATKDGPIVKLVNAILADAIRAGASDIHIEPQEKSINLRYRVDGLLRQIMTIPKRTQNRIVSRIKITAHMDISERRLPQDGRAHVRVAGKPYDLRMSTLPTAEGEKVVIRVLVQQRAQVLLEELGFEPDVLAVFKEMLRRPQGLVLVTGPTGSGKTSTLYAALNFLRDETTNIVTIEDPIEYRLAGVNQVAVSARSGLTFAAGLRSILRQDPNVVMVGEIRDVETAEIVFQAAQTGHLVLSTLHTNDASSAVTRLVEMGVPAYLVASSLLAVLGQRLVRTLCSCKRVDQAGASRPRGCELCNNVGYKGRTAIYELMRATPRVRSVVLAQGSEDLMRRAARSSGMRTMYAHGLVRVREGITTIEEILRVVPPDEAPDVEMAVAELLPGHSLTRVPPALSGDVLSARRTRILAVDDDPQMLQTLRELLQENDYDVVTANNGDEARTLLFSETPDLVLTDLFMPGLDGLGLLALIRGNLSTRNIPVIFLTGVPRVDDEVRAFDLGADDYLTKPIQKRALLSRLRGSLLRAHLLRSG